MNKALFSLAVAGLLTFPACDRKNTPGTIRYPTEKPAAQTAGLFAPGLISTEAIEHSTPAFSPDGKTVLWSVVELPSWKATIFQMDYDGTSWSAPFIPSFNDSTASNISPGFSKDGSRLYFSSDRKLPSGTAPAAGNLLWSVEKRDTGWGIPGPVDSLASMGGAYAPSIAGNGNLYFTHGPFRSPDWNIMMAVNTDGIHKDAQVLPSPVNTSGYEDGPCIAPDESYLIFESDRPGGIGGSIDLYISFKSEDGQWGMPVNLGPAINSSASERFARLSPDGDYLFFGSNRRKVGDEPNFDVYWIAMVQVLALKK